MPPQRKRSKEERDNEVKREEFNAPELAFESEEEGESGAESFLTDDELAYQEGLDPFEE